MIQVYTGCGKGKTTAALGLALRAAGAGLSVYICQFLKCGEYSESKALKKFKNIKVKCFGRKCFIRKALSKADFELANKGLKAAKEAMLKEFDLIILDEINVALHLNLLKLEDVLKLIKILPENTELVLTGRDAHPKILQIADLVSEIKEDKHYYKKGIKARKGIEY